MSQKPRRVPARVPREYRLEPTQDENFFNLQGDFVPEFYHSQEMFNFDFYKILTPTHFMTLFCSNNGKLWNEPSPRKLNLTFDLEEPEMQQIPEVIEKPETTEISIEATLGDERIGLKFDILNKYNNKLSNKKYFESKIRSRAKTSI